MLTNIGWEGVNLYTNLEETFDHNLLQVRACFIRQWQDREGLEMCWHLTSKPGPVSRSYRGVWPLPLLPPALLTSPR